MDKSTVCFYATAWSTVLNEVCVMYVDARETALKSEDANAQSDFQRRVVSASTAQLVQWTMAMAAAMGVKVRRSSHVFPDFGLFCINMHVT